MGKKAIGSKKEESPRRTSPDTVNARELERVLAHRRQALEPLQLLLLAYLHRRQEMPQSVEIVASFNHRKESEDI